MTTIHPRRLFTTQAATAMFDGAPVCDTCRGHGRIHVDDPREKRVCPACGGRGIPRTLRDAAYDGLSRHEWKAYRQAYRSAP